MDELDLIMNKFDRQSQPMNRIILSMLLCLLFTIMIAVVLLVITARTFFIERDSLAAKLHVVQMVLDSTYENTNQDEYKEKWFEESIRQDPITDAFISSMTYPIIKISRVESSPPILGSGVDWIRVQFSDDKIYELVIANYAEKLFGLPIHRPVAFIFDK